MSRPLEAADDRDANRSALAVARARPCAAREPVRAGAVRARHPGIGRACRARWSAAGADRPAHRPLAPGQVPRRRRRRPRGSLVGRLQPAHQRGALRRAAAAHDRPPRRLASCTCAIATWAPIRAGGARCGPTPRPPGPASSAATCSGCRPPADLAGFVPDFTIVDAPSFRADPERDGVRSETVILVHLGRQEILIGGTEYAGEMKKGAFGILNYRLPDEGVLPMHSSVNVGAAGTWPSSSASPGRARPPSPPTPSARSSAMTSTAGVPTACSTSRAAATPRPSACRTSTSPTSTPRRSASAPSSRTWSSTRRAASWTWTRSELTENTRAAFPLDFISNSSDTGMAGQPSNVIFLTADAFGVLPPISRLTPGPGAVPLHQWLHGQARGHRGGRQGADGHVLDLLRGAVHASPPGGVCRDAGRAPG